MPGYTTSFLFPDINVWLALTHARHVHHDVANDWLATRESDVRLRFCRVTQLGFLRLLTAEVVMGEDVLSQVEAWKAYDRWLATGHVEMSEEPPRLDPGFRRLSRSRHASPKNWGDAYLAAFAEASEMTLVTFDRSFRGKLGALILLEE
jgi:toxin-antitoxin system PIN domain toxin